MCNRSAHRIRVLFIYIHIHTIIFINFIKINKCMDVCVHVIWFINAAEMYLLYQSAGTSACFSHCACMGRYVRVCVCMCVCACMCMWATMFLCFSPWNKAETFAANSLRWRQRRQVMCIVVVTSVCVCVYVPWKSLRQLFLSFNCFSCFCDSCVTSRFVSLLDDGHFYLFARCLIHNYIYIYITSLYIYLIGSIY